MKKHLIFDFDGTLWDSFWLALKTLNTFSPYFWYSALTEPEEIENLRKMTPHEILSYMKIAKRKIPFIALIWKLYMKLHRDEISLFDWSASLLKSLHASWHKIYTLSSNSKSLITSFMKEAKIDQLIVDIVWSSSILWKEKSISSLLRKHDLDLESSLYIWDEVRDAQACTKVPIDMVAVWRWYSHPEVLDKQSIPVVTTRKELEKKILSFT